MKYIFIVLSLVVILMTGCDDINSPPTINIPDQLIYETETLVLDLLSYATDVDGDALTFTLLTSIGTLEGHIYTYESTYEEEDSYSITIQVMDSKGATATSTFHIVILHINRPPIIPELLTPSMGAILEETTVLFEWYCSDPDEDQLLSSIMLNESILIDNLTEFTYTVNNLIRDIVYTWSVEVTDGEATVTSNSATFTIIPETVDIVLQATGDLRSPPYIIIEGKQYKLPLIYRTMKGSEVIFEIPSEQQLDTSDYIRGVDTRLDFVQWSDGATITNRTVFADTDITLGLIFDEYYYLRVVPSSPQICTFEETGWYSKDSEVTVIAENYDRWRFYYWDLNRVSRYSFLKTITISLEEPVSLVAYYEYVCPF